MGVVMCLAPAGHMIPRSATSGRWGSESLSECGGEADFVSDCIESKLQGDQEPH
jgi:hypothetical protein